MQEDYSKQHSKQTHNFINRKRQQIRTKIRKNYIDQVFKTSRIRIIQQNKKQQKCLFLKKYQQLASRQAFIQQLKHKLSGKPQLCWKQYFQYMQWITEAYPNQTQLYLANAIIKKICQALQWEYRNLKLARQAAKILYLLTPRQDFNQARYYFSKLLQLNFFQSILKYITNKSVQSRDIIEFVLLLSQLCNSDYAYRDKIVRSQVTDIVLQLFKNNPNPNDIYFTQVILKYGQSMLKIHNPNQVPIFTPKSVLKTFIPVISREIQFIKSQKCRILLFSCLSYIAQQATQVCFKNMITDEQIPNGVLNHLGHQNRMIRISAINVCTYLTTSKQSQIIPNLIKKGLLDKILSSFNSYLDDQLSTQKLMKLLSNIIASYLEQIKYVMQHPTFQEIIIKYSNQLSSTRLLSQSIYSLTTICINGNQQTNKVLIQKYKVLDIFINNLQSHSNIDAIVLQVLKGLSYLIDQGKDQNINHKNNIILNTLCFNYDFEKIISTISQTNRNPQVVNLANKLQEIIEEFEKLNEEEMTE